MENLIDILLFKYRSIEYFHNRWIVVQADKLSMLYHFSLVLED